MIGVVAWVGRTLVAVLAGFAATLAAAAATTTPWRFLAAGAVAAAGAWVGLWVVAAHRQHRGRHRCGTGAASELATGLVLAGLAVAVLIPLRDPIVPPQVPPGAGTWTLDNGTHVFYGVVRASGKRATASALPPVVVLHGGPGVPDLSGELATLGPLALLGRDVYAYARVGAGRSSRLRDPSGYTVSRAVSDLDQLRRRIGASRLVLVGHSYGGYLAAAYLAAHPHRVAKIVLSSPGDLHDGLSGTALQQRLTLGQKLRTYRLVTPPRALLAYALTQVRPASAHAFAGDAELDARNDRIYRAAEPAMHCPGRHLPVLHGTGFYALQVPQSAASPAPDLSGGLPDVPALVIKGQCDYLTWADAVGYVRALPHSHLVYLSGAGHDAYRDQPAAYLAAVRAFLLGHRAPGTLTNPNRPPAGYQDPRPATRPSKGRRSPAGSFRDPRSGRQPP